MELIRVLIVDDNDDTRRNICQMLSFDEQIVVVGEANDGVEAVQKAQDLQPNVVLMDINLPDLDGFSATEKITTDVPGTAVVVTSAQGEKEYLRKAMMVGARDFLVKPLRKEDLINTIKNVFKIENKRTGQNDIKKMPRKSEVITVFGTKGGVGKTTIAVNLAVYLAKCKQKVVLLDFDLQFGDISIFLNLYPRRTISELTQEGDAWDMEL